MPNFFMIMDTHINNFNYSINYNKDIIISVAKWQADHLMIDLYEVLLAKAKEVVMVLPEKRT